MEETVSSNKVVYITYTIWDEGGKLFEQNDLPVAYGHGVNGIPADGGGGSPRLH